MRLSAELINSSEQRPNPLGERELVLRGKGIPFIEHLGITRDAYDTLDLSNNRIMKVSNFPRLKRLSNLMLSSNYIDDILDEKQLTTNLPNLTSLTLSYNRLESLCQILSLSVAFPKLEFLNLIGNPITRKQYYRLYVAHHIPSLKVLDLQRITESERKKAQRLVQSAAGAALEVDVQYERNKQKRAQTNGTAETAAASATKTFVPGGGDGDDDNGTTSMIFTKEQKEQLRQMVATATSPQMIEEIEASVQKGVFPSHLLPATKKRSSADDGDEEGSIKKPKT